MEENHRPKVDDLVLDASVYYGAICREGGYLSYSTNPPQIVPIPPTDCPEVKREVAFEG